MFSRIELLFWSLKRKEFAMRSSVLAVVFLLQLAFSTCSMSECKNSSSCSDGFSCVQGNCFKCKLDPVKCLRSVEICDSLKCASDENCYLQHDVDYASKTATVIPVCSKTDPCSQKSCSGRCATIAAGDQPPTAKCVSTTNSDLCGGYKCPDGYKCYLQTPSSDGRSRKMELSCADLSACADGCGFLKYCALLVQSDGTIKGTCSWSIKLI